MRETEDLLPKPPKKKTERFPQIIYGKLEGSGWVTPLHGIEDGANTVTKKVKEVTHKHNKIEYLTQTTVQLSVSTLNHSLNGDIKRVNERRKEDAVITKDALADLNRSLTTRIDSQIVKVVIMSNYVKDIGQYAFANCEIRTCTFPTSSIEIGSHLFSGSSIEEAIVPANSVICRSAFKTCNLLRLVVMMKAIGRIATIHIII